MFGMLFSDNITELVNTTNREECTFYAHGVCVSFIMERFRPDDTKCLPACTSFQFHMENLHVSKNVLIVRPGSLIRNNLFHILYVTYMK